MLTLVAGIVIFLAVHLVPTAPELRRGLGQRFGEVGYKIAFSLISIIGFAMIAYGYGKLQTMPGKNPVLWDPPSWTRHVTMLLMLFSFLLLVAAYIPSRIRTTFRHPMLLAIKLWALGHLVSNGDLASVVLFGSFLAWAVYDLISVKSRGALGPLGDRQGGIVNDVLVMVVGLALYVAMLLWGHARLIGIPLVPGWS